MVSAIRSLPRLILVGALSLLLLPPAPAAEVPHLVGHQGRLLGADGAPLAPDLGRPT